MVGVAVLWELVNGYFARVVVQRAAGCATNQFCIWICGIGEHQPLSNLYCGPNVLGGCSQIYAGERADRNNSYGCLREGIICWIK